MWRSERGGGGRGTTNALSTLRSLRTSCSDDDDASMDSDVAGSSYTRHCTSTPSVDAPVQYSTRARPGHATRDTPVSPSHQGSRERNRALRILRWTCGLPGRSGKTPSGALVEESSPHSLFTSRTWCKVFEVSAVERAVQRLIGVQQLTTGTW